VGARAEMGNRRRTAVRRHEHGIRADRPRSPGLRGRRRWWCRPQVCYLP